ncbi:hypothetical protein [Methanopyrus kandleri]|uniref:Uncharacterized protein n=1 Tax=Methanopyrus kandleri (strain AV19 / DSM 6324 / JCM 9639 / NBRC 100938) TaxID=190192 RepID=Q8TVS1_METKA|nr:hypothetical protein [Methanopyrus kandleri]AAM02530.1 Uncharacterized protein MK1317 [Methanopyrus kandleri AV19]
MELVLELSLGRFRAGDAIERTRTSVPAQTLFGAILGATLELLRGDGEDPDVVKEVLDALVGGLELTDAFPLDRGGEPLLPVPEHVRRELSDPERYGEVLRELAGDDVDTGTHGLVTEPERLPLSLFTDLCVEGSPTDPATLKRLREWLSGEHDPVVGSGRLTHASVPRTGDDTTPFTLDYASGRGIEGPTHVAFLRYDGKEPDYYDVEALLRAVLRYLRDAGLGGARSRGAGEVLEAGLREPEGEEKLLFSQRMRVEEGEPAITLSACAPEGDAEFYGRVERRGLHYARVGPFVTNYRVPRHYLAATGSYFPEWPGAENLRFEVPEGLLPGFLRGDPMYRGGYELVVYGRGFPVRVRALGDGD